MTYTFQASRLTGGNRVFPDKIIIDDEKITYYKPHLIGHEETNIFKTNIGSVSMNAGLFFSDIIIETNGGQITKLEGFTKSVAREIVKLLSE